MKARSFAAMAVAASMMCAWGQPALAQEAPTQGGGATVYLADSASPFEVLRVSSQDAAKVTMPDLSPRLGAGEVTDFEKYYYFHREDTDFATALADLSECDGYARGLQSRIAYRQAPFPYTYTLGGVLGEAVGNAMAQAIFGSTEKRRLRRVNMRTCMSYKGYQRFGIGKSHWEKFNFEEGNSSIKDEDRIHFLMQQALVASAGKPQGEALGL